MAMAGTGGGMRQVQHMGAGVARREAHHARRADERASLEEVDVDSVLRAEAADTVRIVRLEAGSFEFEDEGQNYAPTVKRESKKERRARQQQKAREQLEAAAPLPPPTEDGDGGEEPPVEAVAFEEEEDGAEPRLVSGRLTNALCDALEEDEDGAEAGEEEVVVAPLLDAHGPDLAFALRYLRRRLKQYLGEQAASRKTVALVRGARGLYPSMQWTIQFGNWLASSRIQQSKVRG